MMSPIGKKRECCYLERENRNTTTDDAQITQK